MTQRGNERVAARQRARERRLALDKDRIAREDRIDTAVGDYELVRAEYAAARDALAAAERKVAGAVAAVLAEGEPAERVAALCEISPAEVRRLAKLADTAGHDTAGQGSGGHDTAGQGSGGKATRKATGGAKASAASAAAAASSAGNRAADGAAAGAAEGAQARAAEGAQARAADVA